MIKRPVYIFARRFKSDTDLINVLSRLDYYGAAYLMKIDSTAHKLVVILNLHKHQDLKILRQSFNNLEVIFLHRGILATPILFMDIKRQFRRLGINPGALISGDPYVSGLLVHVLKQFRFKESTVQFQVHGNPFQYFKFFSMRQLILKFIYLFNLDHADSIRLVSESQLDYGFLKSRLNQAKFFIAPIPILDLKMELSEDRREEGLLFLGRFHQERNLELWLEIAHKLALRFPALKMTMAGSGPLMEFVSKYKATHLSLNSLEILGEIPHSRIEDVLHANTILLSTAEHESYGLSLREAMLCGLFVVAKRNPTTMLLEKDFPNLVCTFTTAIEAIDIIASLIGRTTPKHEIMKVRFQQSSKNLQSVNSLVETWIISH